MKDFYSYPAIFYSDSDGISIHFPDLPGCLPCATNIAEAMSTVREALGLHLLGMELGGEPLPEPTPISRLQPGGGAAAVMVEVSMQPIRQRTKMQTALEETQAAIEEVQRMKADPALGKTYTDVDSMMKDLLETRG